MNIIIGLFSAATGSKYEDRRRACLDTWIPMLPGRICCVWLYGDPDATEPRIVGKLQDICADLWLPCSDDYASLPQKTRLFCRWALSRCDWDYLWKADDDTYLHVPRFCAYDPQGRDYIGAEWKAGVRYASGGAGYWLSRHAAGIVAEKLTAKTGAEDLLVGEILTNEGVTFHKDNEHFRPWGWQACATPDKDPQIISTHAITPQVMRQVHARCFP